MAAGLYDITNEILGKGHFAIVKLAKHCLTGEHVAIKIIDKAKLNKEGLEQLSCEIRLWSILSEHEHPNVVKLYQCIDTRTKLYLVMEYCGSHVCDLYDHIQKKNGGNGLGDEESKHVFRQVCNAIFYCHSLKIVHRDLKPENILIISNQSSKNKSSIDFFPMVKLIDFGFSNQWSENELLRTSCGSLAYSAPEILLGNKYYGPKVDIWGLGCILYICIYGCNPFMQFNDNETLIKILDCSFTTPEKPNVSQESIDLIKGLLRKEPDKRFTIEEIMNHPWLEDKISSKTCDKQEIAKTTVQDHIIDQMIVQGISLSKETIHKILNNEHLSTTETDNLNDHHYIKATYHLLKDKSAREGKGINQNVNSNINYCKRGNILKKPNYTNYKKFHNIQENTTTNLCETNLDAEKSPDSLCSLEVPQNSNSFVLPLARKCSIVSEEGSAYSESNFAESPIPENPNELTNSANMPQATVDIFVTDSSSNTSHNKTGDYLIDCSISQNYEDNYLHKKLASHLSNKESSGLHSVSSSPDFLNSDILDKIDEKSQNFDKNSCDLETLNSKINRNDNFSISHIQDESILSRYSNIMKNKKINNVRIAKPPPPPIETLNPNCQSNKSPSMRVIIQSKSLNNIALTEQSSTDTKLANSISSVSIKAPKADKADCCIIC